PAALPAAVPGHRKVVTEAGDRYERDLVPRDKWRRRIEVPKRGPRSCCKREVLRASRREAAPLRSGAYGLDSWIDWHATGDQIVGAQPRFNFTYDRHLAVLERDHILRRGLCGNSVRRCREHLQLPVSSIQRTTWCRGLERHGRHQIPARPALNVEDKI